ncbi:hypothetical protein BC828DRAFT_376470 [Blastocladiella britannica]|nr:hypothetical protein BC828DRAFT_376470 [Blastocladiella britannica]
MTRPTENSHDLAAEEEEVEVLPGVFFTPRRQQPNRPAPPSSSSTTPETTTTTLAEPASWLMPYLADIRPLSVESLVAEYHAQALSREHLERSNKELQEYAAAEPEGSDDAREFLQAVAENVAVMGRVREKMSAVAWVLERERAVNIAHALGLTKKSDPAAAVATTPVSEPESEEAGVFL